MIGFVTLFLIIPNQIIAQSNDTTTYYDVTEQLDYVSFAIKLEPGLFTKYGRLHHRRMTEEGPDKETITIEVGGVLRGIN